MDGQVRSLRRTASALGAGIVTGVALVTVFSFLSFDSDTLLPPSAAAQVSLLLSIYYAPAIVALSVPIWLLISRLGWDGPLAAACLGSLMTSLVWSLTNQSFSAPTLDDLAIAVCGALAGLATWCVANRR